MYPPEHIGTEKKEVYKIKIKLQMVGFQYLCFNLVV
jgi:hypothetical protein